MNNKPYNGFTLLELVVVIAIAGIVSAIAIPTLITTFHKLRVDKAATQIVWDLKRAQSAAIKNRAVCTVSFGEGGTYTAVVKTNPEKTIVDVDIRDRYPGVNFLRNEGGSADAITFSGDSFNFRPTRKANLNGSIYLMPESDFTSGRKDRWRKITVVTTGRIRIYKYNNGWK